MDLSSLALPTAMTPLKAQFATKSIQKPADPLPVETQAS